MFVTNSPPRVSAWEWAQTALLAANLGWTTLCLGGYRPETMVVTSGLTCALLVVHFAARAFRPSLARAASENHGQDARDTANAAPAHPAGWLLIPFVIYAAANAAWVSPVGWLGWIDVIGWAQMIAVFWVVLNGIRSVAPRRVLFFVLIALGFAGVLLGSYQRFIRPDWQMLGGVRPESFIGRASGSFGIPNSLAALLLLLIPVVAALILRRGARATERVWWGWLLVVFLYGLVLTLSRGAWIALALALTAWPLSNRRWTWRRRALTAAAVVGVLAAAATMIYRESPKARDRMVAFARDSGEVTRPIVWRAAWRLFGGRPVLGTGAGSYNVLFEQHRPERFRDEVVWAHNDYLNTLSDHGAAGFVLLFGACGFIAARCLRRAPAAGPARRGEWLNHRVVRVGFGIGLLAFALQLLVEFHCKIPALAMACATMAGLVVASAWRHCGTARAAGGRIGAAIAAVAIVAAAWWVLPFYLGEARRHRARETIDRLAIAPPEPATHRERLARARADLQRAVALAPSNGQAWSDLSYATALWARVEPGSDGDLGRAAEAAAERALARSRAVYEFWIRRGVARDMQGRWLEGGSDFAQAVAVAPYSAVAWYYYADHLSRKSTERGLADAALAFCLRLDPGNGPAIALRQRLAIGPNPP